jgi:hypothetical protein
MRDMSIIKEKIKKEASGINREMRNKLSGYIAAAFGLVAGLAWNDAIKSFIEYVFPLKENSLTAKFVYAVLVSLILVLISVYIIRFLKVEDEEEKAEEKKKK